MEIGYSELTGSVYMGRSVQSGKFRRWTGEKRDITSEFIGIILQKFGPEAGQAGAKTEIVCGGAPEFEITIKRIERKDPTS